MRLLTNYSFAYLFSTVFFSFKIIPARANTGTTRSLSTMASSSLPITIADRARGALLGFYCGDALAMPVHWYYDVNQLKRDFGAITRYEAPKPSFPGSIMNLSNTGGGGRGSDKGDIVGDVILHGKKKYWLKSGNYHYHHGMAAGENTLDALITRVLTKSMIAKNAFNVKDFTDSYISFMTTPGSHNDAYAGTCHRMFFANWVQGIAPENCAGNDGHNVDSIDLLMIVPPLVVAYLNRPQDELFAAIKSAVQVTRKTEYLRFANLYAELLSNVLKGAPMREAAEALGLKLGINLADAVKRQGSSDPMTACYIDSSFPVLLFFAYKYADSAESLLLASANAGGENVARGSLLGSLAGAQFGLSGLPERFKSDLLHSASLISEATEFTEIFVTK